MRNFFNTFKAVVCLALLAFSTSFAVSSPVDGNGNIVTQSFDVTAFDEIFMTLSAKVNFTVSDAYSCTVMVDENLMEYLDIRVEEGELKLGVTKEGQSRELRPTDFVIEVSAPSLKEIKLVGSGDFEVLNSLKEEKLEVKISGSGNVYIGSGSIHKMEASLTGSGSLEAYCDISVLNAKVSGSGNITANVGTNLFYNMAGSGSIYYYGTPNLKGKKAGSGVLEQLED